MAIRITETGVRTFVLIARYPGSTNPTRRSLGQYGAITLDVARDKARAWIALLKAGKDPQEEEERERQAIEQVKANTFGGMAERFITEKLSTERKGKEAEREIRRELIAPWGDRPITEITSKDVRAVVRSIKSRGAPSQARNVLGYAKRVFGWAVDQEEFGIDASPCDRIKPSNLIGAKQSRDRILTDGELRAFWISAAATPYPVGPIYKLLIMTGLRLNEVADAKWPEFDLSNRTWIIPAERMKLAKDKKPRAHIVPLTDDMVTLLESLPRPAKPKGDFVFSLNAGESAVWVTDKVKGRLDTAMLAALREAAEARGDDPEGVQLDHWINHDLRRTMRSGLSRLRIDEDVAEAVLAHVRPGIKGTYDRYARLKEKKDALERWSVWLRGIVQPPSQTVVAHNCST
jgi:integrase